MVKGKDADSLLAQIGDADADLLTSWRKAAPLEGLDDDQVRTYATNTLRVLEGTELAAAQRNADAAVERGLATPLPLLSTGLAR